MKVFKGMGGHRVVRLKENVWGRHRGDTRGLKGVGRIDYRRALDMFGRASELDARTDWRGLSGETEKGRKKGGQQQRKKERTNGRKKGRKEEINK